MNPKDLPTHLRAVLAERRPAAVRRLLDQHGLVAFAAALAVWSPRVVADVLSLLPQAERAAVLRHLPSALREDDVCVRPVRNLLAERARRLRPQPAASSTAPGMRGHA